MNEDGIGLRRTHLYSYHESFGHIKEFAGFEMPMWYTGINSEHLAVRNNVGIFDVTHMGRSLVYGEDASQFLDYLTTRKPSVLEPFIGHYTTMCGENGGIIDDLTVFCLSEEKYLIVYNASNRVKDYGWLKTHTEDFKVGIDDRSDQISMFSLQGPKSEQTLQKITSTDVGKIKRYRLKWIKAEYLKILATRSGYTGEDGFELYLWDTPISNPERAIALWNSLLRAGEEFEIKPCGLGARDTLRLEAGMCLYGNDIGEKTTPFEARLDFVVKFEKNDFIGRQELIKQRERGVDRIRVGLKMLDRAIPRKGGELRKDGRKIGSITSGTFSPLLRRGIAMGYLLPEYAQQDTKVEVKIRGNLYGAKVVSMPFYDTSRYGSRRKSIGPDASSK